MATFLMSDSQQTNENDKQSKPRWKLALGLLVVVLVGLWLGRGSIAVWMNRQARAAISEGKLEVGKSWLERSESLLADQPEVALLLARYHRRLGRMDKAGEFLKEAQKLGQSPESLQREQVMLLAQLGRLSEAEPFFGPMLTEPGEDAAEICQAIVSGYLIASELGKATTILDSWQADFPESTQPLLLRGELLKTMERWNDAKKIYHKALELDPENADAARSMANVLMHNKDAAEALHYYRISAKHPTGDIKLYAEIGHCLRVLGHYKEAYEWLDRALSKDAKNGEAAFEKAQLEMEEGRYDEAVGYFKIAVESKARDLNVRFGNASALYLAGEKEKAKAEFAWVDEATLAMQKVDELSRAILSQPNDPERRFQIGKLLLQYGSEMEAVGWLNSVLNNAPDHKGTHLELAKYYEAKAATSPEFIELAKNHREKAAAPEK